MWGGGRVLLVVDNIGVGKWEHRLVNAVNKDF